MIKMYLQQYYHFFHRSLYQTLCPKCVGVKWVGTDQPGTVTKGSLCWRARPDDQSGPFYVGWHINLLRFFPSPLPPQAWTFLFSPSQKPIIDGSLQIVTVKPWKCSEENKKVRIICQNNCVFVLSLVVSMN